MPGSYPDPHLYADTAITALERAYSESKNSHSGSLILTALEAITRLRQELKSFSDSDGLSGIDPYETDEYYRAI